MENTINEVMETIVEEAPEMATTVKNYGFGKGALVGLAGGAVVNLGYKFVVKPVVNKIKAKRADKHIQESVDLDSNVVEFSDIETFDEE